MQIKKFLIKIVDFKIDIYMEISTHIFLDKICFE